MTSVPLPTPTPTQAKPATVKYKNCRERKEAGITPRRRATNLELYIFNSALDVVIDGDDQEN